MKPTCLALSAALFSLGMTPALAGGFDHTVLNGQLNLKDVIGEMNVYVGDAGELGQTASAQGNSLEVTLKGSSYTDTSQISRANVEADLNLVGGWIEGHAATVSQSFTNAVTLTGDGTGGVEADNYQEANPSCNSCYHDAKTYIELDGVGVLESSTVAVANSFTASNGNGGMNVNSQQVNNSKMTAVSNIHVGYAGSLNASAASVGNSMVIGK